MRVLIIGGSGFIGRYLARRLSGGLGHDVVGTFLSHAPPDDGNSWHRVELTDAAGLERVFRLARPDVVAHLAAMADVGTAEREPARATAVNVTATSSIARLCALHGARLVFVSTEYVFDGLRGYYKENDLPNPVTHYGRTKWDAEEVDDQAGVRLEHRPHQHRLRLAASGKAELCPLADRTFADRPTVSRPHRRIPDAGVRGTLGGRHRRRWWKVNTKASTTSRGGTGSACTNSASPSRTPSTWTAG